MTTTPPGSSGVADLAVPKLMHPCFSLNVNNNYKNQLFDIFTFGNFAPNICERQCAHFVDALRFTCGERRPPPTWQVGSVGSAQRKINCSNWDIPLTEKGLKDGISLIYTYGTFASGSGEDFTPPYSLDNKSIEYLDSLFIKGFQMKPIVESTKKAEALAGMEEMLETIVKKHPEIIHIAFGNPVVFFGDVVRNQPKYFAPRFELTDKFFATLAKVPTLSSLALALVNITGKESIPDAMIQNLKSIGFYNVTMTSIPDWVTSSSLEFLEFQVTLNDKMDMSGLTTIKSSFLAQSTNLISLTLQCNAINSISEGAFDHLTKLKFLNLAGNRLVTLPEALLAKLDNLLTLDLKATDNTTSAIKTIQTFDETTMQCQIELGYSEQNVLKSMPTVPNPEGILALDIRGQSNFLSQNRQMLGQFKKLEILNLGNLGLTSVQNMSLETLCNLEDINLIGNPLSEEEWIGEDVFVNLNLQKIRLGTPKSMTNVPNPFVSFMRTSSQIMYSAPTSLNQVDFYKNKIGCDYDIISSATLFGYQVQNLSCTDEVKDAIEKIREMEMLKMEAQCQ
ncbi:unnamed protein product [Caenorhabditis sp. 36 PRJEB53466]|nr:unnamed protein product [Caenorhabditis sp. 36 PRJEB53466]